MKILTVNLNYVFLLLFSLQGLEKVLMNSIEFSFLLIRFAFISCPLANEKLIILNRLLVKAFIVVL